MPIHRNPPSYDEMFRSEICRTMITFIDLGKRFQMMECDPEDDAFVAAIRVDTAENGFPRNLLV